MPPLSSARMGLSERSRRRTASAKTARKCSSYSASRAVTDSFAWIEIPILGDGVLSGSNEHRRRRRDGMNPDVGRQMSGGEEREPAGDVLFVERERLAGEENERIEDGAPGDLVIVDRIVEMARADGIFGEDQRARLGVPDRESPVADELGEAIGAPVFVGGGDD